MRGPAMGAHDKSADALARGHDLAAVARGLGDENIAIAARLPFDEAARDGAAHFLVRREEERDRQRGMPPRARDALVGRDREHQPAFHVVDPWPVNPVALPPPWQLASERPQGMNGIHMTQHQDARLVAAGMTAHPQNVTERIAGEIAFAHGTSTVEEMHNRLEHAVDAGGMARGALDRNDAADVVENGVA